MMPFPDDAADSAADDGHCEGGRASSAATAVPLTRRARQIQPTALRPRAPTTEETQTLRVSVRKADSMEPEKLPEGASPAELAEARNAPETTRLSGSVLPVP